MNALPCISTIDHALIDGFDDGLDDERMNFLIVQIQYAILYMKTND